MFQTVYEMAMATICAFLSSKYALPHWKFVLRCCAQCPQIDIPSTEADQNNLDLSRTKSLHVYKHIASFTMQYRSPFNERKQGQLWEASTDEIVTEKNIYKKIACHDGVINCRISSRILHSCNLETCILPTTSTHSWNVSLWQHSSRGIQG